MPVYTRERERELMPVYTRERERIDTCEHSPQGQRK